MPRIILKERTVHLAVHLHVFTKDVDQQKQITFTALSTTKITQNTYH